MSEIYQVELSNLTAFLVEDPVVHLSDNGIKDLFEAIKDINYNIEMSQELAAVAKNPKDLMRFQEQNERVKAHLLDLISKTNLDLVSAHDSQPPISFRLAHLRLSEPTPTGEIRRRVFRLLLTLPGPDLIDAATAFFVSIPRDVRRSLAIEDVINILMPTPGKQAKRTSKARTVNKKEGIKRVNR